jgi:hypothetical protein
MLYFKAIAIWLIFIIAESLNGTIRIFWLIPTFGDSLAHQLSFVTGAALIVAIATLFVPWLHLSRFSEMIKVGFLWMLLTILFEIGLGRFVFGYSWGQIAADYNLLQGNLMSLGLILLVLSPVIGVKIRERLIKSLDDV